MANHVVFIIVLSLIAITGANTVLDVETDAALVATRDKAIIMRKLGELSIPAEAKAVRKATVKAEAAVKKMQEVQVEAAQEATTKIDKAVSHAADIVLDAQQELIVAVESAELAQELAEELSNKAALPNSTAGDKKAAKAAQKAAETAIKKVKTATTKYVMVMFDADSKVQTTMTKAAAEAEEEVVAAKKVADKAVLRASKVLQ